MIALNIAFLTLTFHLATSCGDVGFLLKRKTDTGFLCSPSISEVNGPIDISILLKGENVAGIYQKHSRAVHVCYWKELPGLVPEASLSGGVMYAYGKSMQQI